MPMSPQPHQHGVLSNVWMFAKLIDILVPIANTSNLHTSYEQGERESIPSRVFEFSNCRQPPVALFATFPGEQGKAEEGGF